MIKDMFQEIDRLDELLLDIEHMCDGILVNAPKGVGTAEKFTIEMMYQGQLRLIVKLLQTSRVILDDVARIGMRYGEDETA